MTVDLRIDPLTFPDGYYAAVDTASGITTCWKRTTHKTKLSRKSFGPWRRGVLYGPAADLDRSSIPADRQARDVFLKQFHADSDAWSQPIFAAIAADLPAAQKLFADFTGSCWVCGKALRDPKSKLLGIGPDCRGDR